jgi:uncharacterized protein
MKREQRIVNRSVEVRQQEDGPDLICGYAAVYYDGTPDSEYRLWDGAVERIAPGAFNEALTGDVRGLFNHDPSLALGRTAAGTMRLTADDVGLRYEIAMPDTSTARDVLELVRRGDVTGSSFSFDIRQEDDHWAHEDGRRVRTLKRVQVYDVGPVTFPAYAGTTAYARSEDVAALRQEMDRMDKELQERLAAVQRRAEEVMEQAEAASPEAAEAVEALEEAEEVIADAETPSVEAAAEVVEAAADAFVEAARQFEDAVVANGELDEQAEAVVEEAEKHVEQAVQEGIDVIHAAHQVTGEMETW